MPKIPRPEPWQHRFVEANGLRFHVVIAGPAGGVRSRGLVLLLHGFPEFWYSWRRQIPAMAAAGFDVAAPDLRGYNDSDKPDGIEAYRITNVVEDVAGIIRALGHERACIVGHDWGGAAAYAFAMLHPEMTDRLCVLNSPHPASFSRELQRGNIEQLKKSWYMFFFQLPDAPERLLAADNFRILKGMLAGSARKGTFGPADLARYAEAFAKPGALRSAINWYRAAFRGGLPSVRELPKIAAPTLIIWGDRDFALGKELTRGMRGYFSGAFRIAYLPGVSHWVQQEAPARVNALLTRFLAARFFARGPRP
jgi:pimeloyl-ACP methyl ester carboxylesterase